VTGGPPRVGRASALLVAATAFAQARRYRARLDGTTGRLAGVGSPELIGSGRSVALPAATDANGSSPSIRAALLGAGAGHGGWRSPLEDGYERATKVRRLPGGATSSRCPRVRLQPVAARLAGPAQRRQAPPLRSQDGADAVRRALRAESSERSAGSTTGSCRPEAADPDPPPGAGRRAGSRRSACAPCPRR
jgi:hypothetical protein